MKGKPNSDLASVCTCIGRVLNRFAHQRLSETNLIVIELILLGQLLLAGIVGDITEIPFHAQAPQSHIRLNEKGHVILL